MKIYKIKHGEHCVLTPIPGDNEATIYTEDVRCDVDTKTTCKTTHTEETFSSYSVATFNDRQHVLLDYMLSVLAGHEERVSSLQHQVNTLSDSLRKLQNNKSNKKKGDK